LLDPISLADLADYQTHPDPVFRVAFDSDGNFATGSNKEIVLWSGTTRTPLGSMPRADSSANSLTSLALRGKTLLEGTSSGAIVLWDVTDAAHPLRIAELTSHTSPVTALDFSPDGQAFVSGSDDGMFRLWPLRPEAWTAIACQVAARNLTADEWAEYLYFIPRYRATCDTIRVNTRDIVASYLERAKQHATFNQTEAMTQALEEAQVLSDRSTDFYATELICEFMLEQKLEDTGHQNCPHAVKLSLQADSYDEPFSICQLGMSYNMKDMVLPACTRAVELSLRVNSYDQAFSFCQLGISNNLRDVVLPTCTRAGELSATSDDYA
jgi:hypothetical protein